MTCREIADFLMDYLEGSLPPGQREVFENHLKVCPDCRNYLDSYKKTVAMGQAAYSDHEESKVPEQLVKSILAARVPGTN